MAANAFFLEKHSRLKSFPQSRSRKAAPAKPLRQGYARRVSRIDDPADIARVSHRLVELRESHRDLDAAIGRLQEDPDADELAIRRLKKRKLQLKDQIAQLEAQLVPDEPA